MPAPIMATLTARYESRTDETDPYNPPMGYVVLAFGNADVASWPIPLLNVPADPRDH